MSLDVYGKEREQAGTLASPITFSVGAPAVRLRKTAGNPFDVYRVGIIPTTAFSGTQSVFQLRTTSPIGGAPVVRATVTFPAVVAVGKVTFADVIVPIAAAAGDDSLEPGNPAMPRSVINVDPFGPILVDPGQEFDINQTVASTAGAGILFVEFVEYDGSGARFSNNAIAASSVA